MNYRIYCFCDIGAGLVILVWLLLVVRGALFKMSISLTSNTILPLLFMC